MKLGRQVKGQLTDKGKLVVACKEQLEREMEKWTQVKTIETGKKKGLCFMV